MEKKSSISVKARTVSVEIEKYTKDLSSYMFVTFQGYLEEVHDSIEKQIIREKFVDLIVERNLSCNILAALGDSPSGPTGCNCCRGSFTCLETCRC